MAEARVVAGRYRLTRQLGRGGMGAVWLGEDELAGRLVAVKEIRAPDGVTEAEREVFRKRALQEARSAARLAHPNAVVLHDIIPPSAADDAVYLIMEYIDGDTLAQVIERDGPLGEPWTAGSGFSGHPALAATGDPRTGRAEHAYVRYSPDSPWPALRSERGLSHASRRRR